MPTSVVFNNTTYQIPLVGERLWGLNVRNFLISVAGNALSKAGGNFTLTADTNFGATYGLVSKYFKSVSSNISTTGVLRLANNEGIGWRNAANNADQILKLDAGNRLELDGVDIPTISSTDTFTNKSISGATNTLSAIPASSLASTTGTGAVVLASGATLTSPAITTPTGIVKGDVGLGNVDNTSDATKNAASVSLTNKTLVTPIIDDYLELNEESAPSTPSSGKVRVYAKTDKKIYTKDSAGTESQVGASGSGELNLIENPSDAVNWSETGTVFSSPITTTTAGDLPLGGLTDTAIQLVASGNGAEASHYNSYSFTTPASLSGKMKVEFYQRPGTGFAESEWTVSVYQSTTRQSLSTDSSGVTYLVNASNKRTVYVDLLASTAYTLRFARVAGSGSATLNISNVIVGPGIQPQGAVVGEWQPITFAAPSNLGAGSGTTDAWLRRIGSTTELRLRFVKDVTPGSGASVVTFTVPSGYTIDTTKLTSSNMLGNGAFTGAVYGPRVDVFKSTGNTFVITKNGGATFLTGADFTANSEVNLELNIPIAEWAGSGTVNLAQNDVEYAYNTGTWDAADTSSFAYGPSGRVMGGSLTAERTKRVRFQSSIQPGDKIEVELSTDQRLWVTVANAKTSAGQVSQGTILDSAAASAGIFWTYVSGSTTDVDVVFARYQTIYNGSSVINWPSDAYWRVRKSSAGAAVGFGIADTTSSGLVPSGTYNKSTGAWTLGLTQSLNYNGPMHQIAGASLMVATPTSTNTDQAGAFELGTNIYRNTYGNRFSSVTGGTGIAFNNRTSNTTEGLTFYANKAGDSLTTGVFVAGSMTQNGAWTFGPSSGLTEGHTIRNSSSTTPALTITNTNTGTTASDGLRIFAGGTTGNSVVLGAFDAGSTVDQFYVKSSGVIGVRTSNWGTGGTAIGVSSSVLTTSPSSRRYKENETPLSIDSSKIYDIEIKEFDYIEAKGGAHDFGPMAEDVEAILPEIVWKEDGQPESIRESKMVWLILEEMKKLKAELDAAKARIATLEGNS
jgi:hypothetical protein